MSTFLQILPLRIKTAFSNGISANGKVSAWVLLRCNFIVVTVVEETGIPFDNLIYRYIYEVFLQPSGRNPLTPPLTTSIVQWHRVMPKFNYVWYGVCCMGLFMQKKREKFSLTL